jgi:hypothetical protein
LGRNQQPAGSFGHGSFWVAAYRFLMLSQRGLYHSAVEKDLGRVGNLSKGGKGFVELITVIVIERLDPSLDFLLGIKVRLLVTA